MSMNVVYLGVSGAWGANVLVAGVPTQIPPVESYSHSAITIVNGVITAIDFSALGGAGTSDHQELTNLGWDSSGHLGTASTIAGFASDTTATYYGIGTGLAISGGDLVCTVSSGTTDHAALSNLSWGLSGHTGTATYVPYFNGSGVASESSGFTFTDGTGTLTATHLESTGSSLLASLTVTGGCSVKDSQLVIANATTSTKQASFSCAGLTAGVVRTFTLPDASTTLVGADTTQTLTNKTIGTTQLSGAIQAANFPALTGDVTTTAGSLATTIGANKVTNAMLRQGVARSVVGVTGNATANVADIQGTANQVLVINSAGTAMVFGQVNLASSAAVTGALVLANGGTGADLSATGPGFAIQATSGAAFTLTADMLIVKNTSGSTANASECGYIDSAGEYKTTTTANLEGNWCVVISGAANNSDIVVARRGRVTIKCTASNSVGNFLALSTTAGQAVSSSTMRGECFAVVTTANGSGAGGTCTALLLTQTRFVPTSNTNFGYHIASHADTDFVATINGAPSTTSVVYNAPSAGSDTVIKPNSSSNYLKARLYNTTRGTYRLIDSVNTATKTITTVASTDSWASGDTIKIESQTITSGTTAKMIELDATQSAALSAIPATARAAVFEITVFDSTAVNKAVFLHPFETFASSKQTGGRNANTGASMLSHVTIKLINRVFGILSEAGGATSKTTALALVGYHEAVP